MVEALTDTRCTLGEGPLWHPLRDELFWFDITGQRLYACSATGGNAREWAFDMPVSAAGWIDRRGLLIAAAGALLRFDIETGAHTVIAPLEADRPGNRSNDGRTAPDGAFWIGTMGRAAEPGAGALYRAAGGAPVRWRSGISVPNATAFSPDGAWMYFADTNEGLIRRWPLEDGMPRGEGDIFVDLRGAGPGGTDMRPDGAVCDSEGALWCALWGGWRVVRFLPDGTREREVEVPVAQPTCPALGGPDLRTLFITSARQGLSDEALAAQPLAGAVLHLPVEVAGVPEYRVRPEEA